MKSRGGQRPLRSIRIPIAHLDIVLLRPHLPSSEMVRGWDMDGLWMVQPSSVLTRAERQNDLITKFSQPHRALTPNFFRGRPKHVAWSNPMAQRIRSNAWISNSTMSKAAGRAGRLAEAMTSGCAACSPKRARPASRLTVSARATSSS